VAVLSQFLHGEQGALLAASQLVTGASPTPTPSTTRRPRVMDEARHVEVYDRYLHQKSGGATPSAST